MAQFKKQGKSSVDLCNGSQAISQQQSTRPIRPHANTMLIDPKKINQEKVNAKDKFIDFQKIPSQNLENQLQSKQSNKGLICRSSINQIENEQIQGTMLQASYLIVKVRPDCQTNAKIKVIRSLEGAETPSIEKLLTLNMYSVYKVKLSSLIIDYEVILHSSKSQLSTQSIKVNDKLQSKFLFSKCFSFNFMRVTKGSLGVLEKIIIFSIHPQTQQPTILKQNLQNALKNNQSQLFISNQLIDAVVNYQGNKQLFYELMLGIIGNWSGVQVAGLQNWEIQANKLIAKSFIKERNCPFNGEQKVNLKNRFYYTLVDIIFKSSQQILNRQQKLLMVKKILEELTEKQDCKLFIYTLKMVLIERKKNQFLYTLYHQSNFNKLIDKISTDTSKKLTCELFSAVYYSNILYEKYNKVEALFAIINGITPINNRIIIENSGFLLSLITHFQQMLDKDDCLRNVKDLSINQFNKLARLYPIFTTLSQFGLKLGILNSEVKSYINKNIITTMTENQQPQCYLQIIKLIYLSSTSPKCFTQNKQKQFNAAVVSLIKLSTKEKRSFFQQIFSQQSSQPISQSALMKINSMLVVQAAKLKYDIFDLTQQYIKVLKKRSFQSAKKILSCGVTANSFMQQESEQTFTKIISAVVEHFITKKNYQNFMQLPQYSLQGYCLLVNEQLIEKLVFLWQRNSNSTVLSTFYSNLHSFIEDKSPPDQKEQLEIIAVQHHMLLKKEEIIEKIKQNEKNFINLLINRIEKNKNTSKINEVTQLLKKIQMQFDSCLITYEDLQKILPNTQKDRKRFVKLFTENVYNKMLTQFNNVKNKINRLERIKRFINAAKTQYFINNSQITQYITEVNKNLDLLKKLTTAQSKKVTSFNEFQESVLLLYEYPFFLKQFHFSENSLELLFQRAGGRVNSITRKIRSVLRSLKNRQLNFTQYSHFGFGSFSKQQLTDILQVCNFENLQSEVTEIQNATNLIKKIQFCRKVCKSLIHLLQKDAKQLANHSSTLNRILQFFQKMQHSQGSLQKSISFDQIESNLSNVFQILGSLGINNAHKQLLQIIFNFPLSNICSRLVELPQLWKGSSAIVISLLIISERMNILNKLRQLKESIKIIQQLTFDNPQQFMNLNHNDFHNFELIIIEFYDKSGLSNITSLPMFIKHIQSFSLKLSEKEEIFNEKLISLTNISDQFVDSYNIYNYQHNPLRRQISHITKLVDNCVVEIDWITQPYGYEFNIKTRNPSNPKSMSQQFTIDQLSRFKNQANFIKKKVDDCQDEKQKQQILKKINAFLQMQQILRELNDALNKLKNQSFMVFTDSKESVTIKTGDFTNIKKMKDKFTKMQTQWKSAMTKIYELSSDATLLRGQKLKNFYQTIVQNKDNKQLSNFREIIRTEQLQQTLKKFHTSNNNKYTNQQLRKQNEKNPLKCLQVIKQFFALYILYIPQFVDKEQYVKIVIFSDEAFDYIIALNQFRPEKVKNLKESQIITCRKDTSKQQIELFMKRCFGDPDKEYAMFGYDNLNQQIEQLIIQKVKETLNNNNNKMKLCFVGQKTAHMLWRFLIQKMNAKIIQLKGSKMELKPQLKEMLEERLIGKNNQYGKVKIFSSMCSGLGKTYQIQQQIAKNNRTAVLFPISGRTTPENLCNRIKAKTNKNKQFDLVIQLYEIQPDSLIIVNDFIRQISIFRIYNYSMQICCLPQKTNVYFEIQDERMLEKLTFIKFIHSNFKQIITNIQMFEIGKIKYEITNVKLAYILQHLQSYDCGLLDKNDILRFDERVKKPQKIVKNYVQLLTKYFQIPFSRLAQPTYYQFNYWVNLFFESCCSFSGSYQMTYQYFKKDYDQRQIRKYNLQKIRSQFFKVLIDNSIEFLVFSAEDLLKKPPKQQLAGEGKPKVHFKQMPLLIIPNNNCLWFSFIFRKYTHLPKAVLSFFVSQAMIVEKSTFQQKNINEIQEILGKRFQLSEQSNLDKTMYSKKLQEILKDISGNRSYTTSNDRGYVLNIDNFMKMCLISCKMKAHIPILIQGEVGIGKTALLRHLIEHVFQYKFIRHNINNVSTQQSLRKKIEDIENECNPIKQLNNTMTEVKSKVLKVCILFDEFNTLPQLAYIKQIMMQHKFMGQQKNFLQNVILFAACNPYRLLNFEKQEKRKQSQKTAKPSFIVKLPPLSMRQIMWNFGSLNKVQTNKYITKMLQQIDNDLPIHKFVNLICEIHHCLCQKCQLGSLSLRDIERFRQIYHWLKQNLPKQSKIINKSEVVLTYYNNMSMRAFIVSLELVYLSKLNVQLKSNYVRDIINKNKSNPIIEDCRQLDYDSMMEIKKFEEDDFSQRIKVNQQGICLNSVLKENLYCIFICIMTRIPLIIIGNPGSSKSLACRIICDNLRDSNDQWTNKDSWLSKFPKIIEFFVQGSESCTTNSVENRFKSANEFAENNIKSMKNKSQKKIPLLTFDEIDLAWRSSDNPLKIINEPLQLINGKQRQIAFVGLSNTDLDISKMSRMLVLRRTDLEVSDLKLATKQIYRKAFNETIDKINHTFIQSYLDRLSETYDYFVNQWKQNQDSQTIPNFYGLRDFYNFIRTLIDLIKSNENKDKLEDMIDDCCDLAIFKSFNGQSNSYQSFKQHFFKLINKQIPHKQRNVLQVVMWSLQKGSRRLPLIIVDDNVSKTALCCKIKNSFKDIEMVYGSPFISDVTNSEYVANSLSQIIKLVESNKKAIITSVNKTTESALLDLFNKLFMKKGGLDVIRVGKTASNLKFNGVVIMDKNEVRNKSLAFLNRFQKYSFDFTLSKEGHQIYQSIQSKLKRLQQICIDKELSHYKVSNLFMNYSQRTLKSLIQKVMSQCNKFDQKEVQEICIKTLSKVSSKDFQYILNLAILTDKHYTNEEYVKQLKKGLQQKQGQLRKCEKAILLTTGKTYQNSKINQKVLTLQFIKNENDLVKQIKQYFISKQNQQGTLVIDFSRKSVDQSANLNDKTQYFEKDKNQQRIETDYIITIIEKCKIQVEQQTGRKINKKIRIVLNYNRNKLQQFTQLSFMSQYSIFSVDEQSGQLDKTKIFQNLNMGDIIKKSLEKLNISIAQFQSNDETDKLIKQFTNQISKNQSIFAECCKDALLILQDDNNISHDDILTCLQISENLTKYNSICTVLTEEYCEIQYIYPIVVLLVTLNQQKVLYSYTDFAKMSLLSKTISWPYQYEKNQQKCSNQMKRFLIEMSKQKIQQQKAKYRSMKKEFQKNRYKKQLKLNIPTYFPYSHIETNILFSSQMLTKIKSTVNPLESGNKLNRSKIDQFEKQYNKKLAQNFIGSDLFTLYNSLAKSTQKYWKRMHLADILVLFCQKTKIPKTLVFHFLKQLQIQLKQHQNSFMMMIILLLGNFQLWAAQFRLINNLSTYGINKNFIQQTEIFKIEDFPYFLIKYVKDTLAFNQKGLKKIKGNNDDQRLSTFIQIHHSIYYEIQNIKNQDKRRYKQYTDLTITEQFITLLQNINSNQEQKTDITQLLKDLDGPENQSIFAKISTILQFLQGFLSKRNKSQKIVYEYIGNQIFPNWFKLCYYEAQLSSVYTKFYEFCNRSQLFVNNSVGSVQIGLNQLQIQYQNDKIKDIFQQLNKNFKNGKQLKMLMLAKMGEDCEKSKFANNLSIFICNTFFMNLKNKNTLIKNNSDKNGFTMEDLKNNYDHFIACLTQLGKKETPILKLFCFAFVKLYLYYYILLAKSEDQTCVQIDQQLCKEGALMLNLRFYCLRLLRMSKTTQQITNRYLLSEKYVWCTKFKFQMKEQKCRQIQVPKIHLTMINNQLNRIMQDFVESQGRRFQLIDQIVEIGAKTPQNRYIMLNFFLKSIYSLAYNSVQYKAAIVQHITSRSSRYTNLIGRVQYDLILRYANSKFDNTYFVNEYQTFEQQHLIIFNNLNWLIASKYSESPIHSLFFNKGVIHESIEKVISTSFLPCGPENQFINIAKSVYTDTRNNDIGVYICSKNCDYIYSILDCGWPNEVRKCEMCGKKIGGAEHKLVSTDKGARRLISQKFENNATFYISKFLKMQQYWDAQRCYIQAQINRMRTKKQITIKPLMGKVRKQEKHNLLGYNISISNNRISIVSSRVLILCIQSLLYCFVSMNVIKPEKCLKLFGNSDKQKALKQINTRIHQQIKQLKEVVSLNIKFFTWIFGIQAEIYMSLMKFNDKYKQHLKKMENKSIEICKKLNQKNQTLSESKYKQLYNDMMKVIQSGLIKKQFKEINEKGQMNANNQFTREVLQQKVEQIVSSAMNEGKFTFVNAFHEEQGKIKFQFEPKLNQSEYDQHYIYSKILKTPCETLTLNEIATKYEAIIKARYPVLDYLIKNIENFKLLKSFNEVISCCNEFWKQANTKLTRNHCKTCSIEEFVKQTTINNEKINYSTFFDKWKYISTNIGPIQGQCKIQGTMNDQLTMKSPIYNFLLDNQVQDNANGKIMVRIYHNFAKLHNETLRQLRARKNMIPKYRNWNILMKNYKLSPQQVTTDNMIQLDEEQTLRKIMDFSVPSIKYGQNIFYHNFDFCQASFLQKFKDKLELQQSIETYKSVTYVGETFSGVAVGTNMNAIADIRNIKGAYQSLKDSQIQRINQWLEQTKEPSIYFLLGELQTLLNKLSFNIKLVYNQIQSTISDIIISKFGELHFEILKVEPFANLPLANLISLFEFIQEKLRPTMVVAVKYSKQLGGSEVTKIEQYLESLSKDGSDGNPTAKQLLKTTENFVYRNLLSQFIPQDKKIINYLACEQDLWPLGYTIQGKNENLCGVINQLQVKFAFSFIKVLQKFVNKQSAALKNTSPSQ